jgi:S-adenosylmethionine:tRNA ribosyltransferase-isomerase
MRTSDFYYELPQELIAQDPLEDRSSSRLMHLSMADGSIEHRHFRDILDYLNEGDTLVINDTKVIPARLYGHKEETGAVIEILLLKRRENDIWECLVKPGKKARPGAKITFGDGILKGEIIDVVDEGNRLIQFHYEGIFEEILDQLGEMPLPPYITHKLKDKNRYQTVYAKNEGSAAAPTAGLHFTKELLEQVKAKGVNIAHVTLHVGLGTFRPVKVDDVEQHHMHSEFYIVEEDQAKLINDTRKNGGRVIAVGTTSCRTLESATGADGVLKSGSGWTEIFIYPGYKFKMIDGLITNEPGVTLATFYADCVPLYFYDSIHKAIGLSHSGWRGTVGNIAKATVEAMQKTYHTDPADLIAAIGPSICQDCYEVSEDVIEEFRQAYPETIHTKLFYRKPNGKYQLNLWEACHQNFLTSGIREENILTPNLCTCCNPDFLYSHRASHGKRGNLAAFLGLR